MSEPELKPDSKEALHRDAVGACEELKQKHRDFFRNAPKAFREIVRKASGRVFRLKPGPKPQRNPSTARAARQRGRGVPWKELYCMYVDGWAGMHEYTRAYAEDGFRRQVNTYLRNHPRLRSPKGTSSKDLAGAPGD
jgi:hypothetical protein